MSLTTDFPSVILPELYAVDNPPPAEEAPYLPTVEEFTPGTVFRAIDESMFAPEPARYFVEEPIDAWGYIRVEIHYPNEDIAPCVNHVCASNLMIVEVW